MPAAAQGTAALSFLTCSHETFTTSQAREEASLHPEPFQQLSAPGHWVLAMAPERWNQASHPRSKKPDLPSGLGTGLSGGAGVDRMLLPIALSPWAVEDARSLRHRGYTQQVSHAPTPLGEE